MKQPSNIFIYVLYALFAGVVFLYLLFPSEPVKEILETQLAKTNSQIEIQTDAVRPTIPPGLRFQPLSVSFAGKPLISSNRVKVRPHLLSLIRDTKIFSFNGPLGSGKFDGRAELEHTLKNTQDVINVNLNDVPLEAIALFKQWPKFKPSGPIDGQFTYDSLKGATGRVDAEISIAPMRIVMDPPIMGMGVLEFTEFQAEFTVTPRQLTIQRCEASGPQVSGRISGFISLRETIGDSRPTLSLTIKPQPDFIAEHKNDIIGGLLSSSKAQKRGVVFKISGTIDNPSYVIR